MHVFKQKFKMQFCVSNKALTSEQVVKKIKIKIQNKNNPGVFKNGGWMISLCFSH